MSGPPVSAGFDDKHELVLRLDGFAHDALLLESDNLGVPASELAVFAILYYLADIDSDRVARKPPDVRSGKSGSAPSD